MRSERLDPIAGRIIEAIGRNGEFLVLTHVNPDGDAVGSAVALGRVLGKMGKSRYVLSPGEIPEEYSFLAERGDISERLPARQKWEVVFILDTPCKSRLPVSLSGEVPAFGELINIDHHASNAIDGTLNWVEAGASSVGEMLYRLFDEAGYAISADVAMPLYAAILTDTGSFRFPNTRPATLRAAAQLLERGAEAANVADRVYGSRSVRKLRLLGEALGTLQVKCSGRVALMWVTREMLRKVEATLLETDGFVDFPRKVRGAEVAIVFKEQEDGHTVKVSLRSRRRVVDVSRVAAKYGGGGHATAAGCVTSGPMQLVEEEMLKAVAEELARADAEGRPREAESPGKG